MLSQQNTSVRTESPRYRICMVSIFIAATFLFLIDAFAYGLLSAKFSHIIQKMGMDIVTNDDNHYFSRPTVPPYLAVESEFLSREASSTPDRSEVTNDTYQRRNVTSKQTIAAPNVGGITARPASSQSKDPKAAVARTGEDAIYVSQKSPIVSDYERNRLKGIGLEPAEDHVFKSPFLVTPVIYPQSIPPAPGKRETKLISVFNAPPWYTLNGKMVGYNCNFTQCEYKECEIDVHGKRSIEADLFIFFVGRIGQRPIPPRREGQLWAKAYWESPAHYGYPGNYAPWRSAFNLTFNYRLDSDIWAPNNRFAWHHRDLLLSDAEYLEIANRKSKPVAWFVSNCRTQGRREDYVKEMKKYIAVDIYGGCSSLKCGKTGMENCLAMLNNTYHFYLSFENSLCKDYITEKFYRNFNPRTHIVPVSRGGADYKKFFPPGAFVDAKDFPKARDLALYLKELMSDKPRYAHMLREKDRLVALGYKHDWCDVCKKLHTEGFPPKIIPDIKMWSHNGTCQKPTDIR